MAGLPYCDSVTYKMTKCSDSLEVGMYLVNLDDTQSSYQNQNYYY